MRRILAILVVLVVAGFILPHKTSATSTGIQGITISPYLQQINIGAGPSTTPVHYSITNNTANSLSLRISTVDFGSLNETGGVAFLGGTANEFEGSHGLSAWMRVSQPDITIRPHQKIDAEATINDDGSLGPGGHYGAILVSTLPGGQSAAVRLNQTVSSLIMAVKQGGIKYDLSLASISTNGNFIHPPKLATLRFYDPGNVQVVPRGIVRLYDGKRLSSQGIINADSNFVLPGSYRLIYVPLEKVHGSGIHILYSFKMQVYFRYDGYNKFALKTYTIRWLNWPLVLALILVIATISWPIVRRHRSKKKRIRVKFL